MRTCYVILLLCLSLCANVVRADNPAQLIPAEKLFRAKEVGNFKLGPSGQQLAFVTLEANTYKLYVVATDSNEVVRQLVFHRKTITDYEWLSDDRLLVQLRDSTIVADIRPQKVISKTIEADGEVVFVRYQQQADQVLFVRSIPGKARNIVEMLAVDIDDLLVDDFSNAQIIADRDLRFNLVSYDPNFDKLIGFKRDGDEPIVSIHYADLGKHNWKKAYSIDLESEEELIMPHAFAGNDRFAVITDKDTETKALRIYDIANAELTDEILYEHPRYDLTDAGFNRDGSVNYVSYRVDGLLHTEYFDAQARQFYQQLTELFDQHEVQSVSQSADGNKQILYTNGAQDPGSYHLYDRSLHQLLPLSVENPQLDGYLMSGSELITVTTSDGTQLEGYLSTPVNGIDHKVLLVMPHGGPVGVRDDNRFNPEVQYFTSRGFSVLRVNFRGSSGFGKAFREQGVGQFGQLIEDDITAMVDDVLQRNQYQHICAMGASYGAYSSVMLAIRQPHRYDCVVAGFGIFDLALIFNQNNLIVSGEDRYRVENVIGEYQRSLVDISPVYLADQLKAPILIYAGALDPIADFDHSLRLHMALNQHRHPQHELIQYSKARHGHPTWWGDRHEMIAKYDFIMRALQLPVPNKAEFSADDQSTMRNEFELLGDGFFENKLIPVDASRAMRGYRRAAELGSSLALFRTAKQALESARNEQEITTAIAQLEQSATQDNADAQALLAKIYSRGLYGRFDAKRAQRHADALPSAQLPKVAKETLAIAMTCQVKVTEEDCIEPFRKNTDWMLKTSNDSLWWNDSMSRILTSAEVGSEQRQALWQVMAKVVQYSKDIELSKVVEIGLFERIGDVFHALADHQQVLSLAQYSQSMRSIEERELAVGLTFEVEFDGLDQHKDVSAVIIHWQAYDNQTGLLVRDEMRMLTNGPRSQWGSFQQQLVADTRWQVSVYDVHGKLLLQQNFAVLP